MLSQKASRSIRSSCVMLALPPGRLVEKFLLCDDLYFCETTRLKGYLVFSLTGGNTLTAFWRVSPMKAWPITKIAWLWDSYLVPRIDGIWILFPRVLHFWSLVPLRIAIYPAVVVNGGDTYRPLGYGSLSSRNESRSCFRMWKSRLRGALIAVFRQSRNQTSALVLGEAFECHTLQDQFSWRIVPFSQITDFDRKVRAILWMIDGSNVKFSKGLEKGSIRRQVYLQEAVSEAVIVVKARSCVQLR